VSNKCEFVAFYQMAEVEDEEYEVGAYSILQFYAMRLTVRQRLSYKPASIANARTKSFGYEILSVLYSYVYNVRLSVIEIFSQSTC
jgi:hypothetical protein